MSRVGGTELFSSKIRSSLRILQLAWHPYSDTHLGVLSTDGVFRFVFFFSDLLTLHASLGSDNLLSIPLKG